jgi:predicted  nucleic acid-binding Zn-ribbon protein
MKSDLPSPRRLQCANVGVGILIFLSVCLCGLVVFQWIVQSKLREMVESEHRENNALLGAKQELENKAKRYADEVAHIQEMRTQIEAEQKTNRSELTRMKNELVRYRSAAEYGSNATLVFSNALMKANTNVIILNDQAAQLVEATRKAMEDRNTVVSNLNSLSTKYSELVTNYNSVVDQFEDFKKKVTEMMNKK